MSEHLHHKSILQSFYLIGFHSIPLFNQGKNFKELMIQRRALFWRAKTSRTRRGMNLIGKVAPSQETLSFPYSLMNILLYLEVEFFLLSLLRPTPQKEMRPADWAPEEGNNWRLQSWSNWAALPFGQYRIHKQQSESHFFPGFGLLEKSHFCLRNHSPIGRGW